MGTAGVRTAFLRLAALGECVLARLSNHNSSSSAIRRPVVCRQRVQIKLGHCPDWTEGSSTENPPTE
jgi:hypothetical protein